MNLFDIAVGGKLCGGGGGDTPTLIDKTISANGTYNASDDEADGYKKVVANVPNTYASGDEGKVVSNGALVAQSSVTKTANGTYDTTLNDEVVVNVPQPTGNIDITSMAQTDVSGYATAQVVDADLVAGNIKKDINILGVTGTYEGGGGGGYTLLGSVEVSLASVTSSSSTLYTFENLAGSWDSGIILYLKARNKNGKVASSWFGNDMWVINDEEAEGGTSSLTNSCKRGFLYGTTYSGSSVLVNDGLSYGVYMGVFPTAVKIYGRSSTNTGGMTSATAVIELYALHWPDGSSPFE